MHKLVGTFSVFDSVSVGYLRACVLVVGMMMNARLTRQPERFSYKYCIYIFVICCTGENIKYYSDIEC